MGCITEYCKKRKNNKPPLPVGRKDTKLVAESYQHVKIEINNNNNSNSKEMPLINNFFKETLNNPKLFEQKNDSKRKDSKSKKSESNKENIITKDIK